jgi:signal peptidase I
MGTFLWSRRLGVGAVLGVIGLVHMLCPFQVGIVRGASMEPSFHSGQVIVIDRHHYRQHPVRRGDVIVLREGDSILIKRVHAVAGDRIWTLLCTEDGELYREIVEPFMLPRVQRLMPLLPFYRLTRYTVPPGTVYVVGDHTSASVDSRHFGPIPVSDILGRVTNSPPIAHPRARTRIARSKPHDGEGTTFVEQAQKQ